MSVNSEIMRRLSLIDMSGEALREVLAIMADMTAGDDNRRAKDRDRKRASRGQSADCPGNVPEMSADKAPSRLPQRDINQTPSTHPKSSLRSESAKSAQGFDSFWSVVPRKTGKDAAEKAYRQKIAAGRATPSEILAGAIRWRDEAKHDDPQYVPHPATWLNRGGWEDEPRSQQARAGPRGAAPASRPSHLSVLLKDLGHDQQPPQHQDSRPFIDAEPARSEPVDRSLRHAQPSRAKSERGDLLSLERRSERQRARMDDG